MMKTAMIPLLLLLALSSAWGQENTDTEREAAAAVNEFMASTLRLCSGVGKIGKLVMEARQAGYDAAVITRQTHEQFVGSMGAEAADAMRDILAEAETATIETTPELQNFRALQFQLGVNGQCIKYWMDKTEAIKATAP